MDGIMNRLMILFAGFAFGLLTGALFTASEPMPWGAMAMGVGLTFMVIAVVKAILAKE